MKLLHIALAAVLCLWAASAQANPAADSSKVDKFALMDTDKDGKVTYNKVELGRRMGAEYELISGVPDNSRVVIAGQTKLVNGMEVEIAVSD